VLVGNWSFVETLHVWHTWFAWDGLVQTNQSVFFEQLSEVTVVNGTFSLTINPDDLYTVTTLNAGQRVDLPDPPLPSPFPSSYSDDFEGYAEFAEARYFSDQAGSFEIFNSNSSHGLVMRQSVPVVPIRWDADYAPYSIIGDVKWSDAMISAEVLVETAGAAFIGARVGTCCFPGGVFLAVSAVEQAWLLTDSLNMSPALALASGPLTVETNAWYNLTLSVVGTAVDATIDGQQVCLRRLDFNFTSFSGCQWLPAQCCELGLGCDRLQSRG
jgi:galactosylceramidase